MAAITEIKIENGEVWAKLWTYRGGSGTGDIKFSVFTAEEIEDVKKQERQRIIGIIARGE
jgi:hypothetical protein